MKSQVREDLSENSPAEENRRLGVGGGLAWSPAEARFTNSHKASGQRDHEHRKEFELPEV
jgi:hypothetical protein